MSRWSTAGNIAEAAKEQQRMLFFVELVVVSSTLYMHTGIGTITTGGHDYSGLGALGEIEPIKSDADPFPRSVKLKLSGLNSTLVGDVLAESLFNKAVTIKRGFIDINSGALVSVLDTIWSGLVNKCDIHVSDGGQTWVEMTCEGRLRREPKAAYYTKEDLGLDYSGDTFFNYLSEIALFSGNWGNRAVGPPVAYTGGTDGGGWPDGVPPWQLTGF